MRDVAANSSSVKGFERETFDIVKVATRKKRKGEHGQVKPAQVRVSE